LSLEDALHVAAPGNGRRASLSIVPIAVDTCQLQPVRRRTDSKNIITLGTLHYPPNADGIRWFLKEVFPTIRNRTPEATLTIIGKHPPADFLAAQARDPESIRVTGYVPELPPYLEDSALMVVPVRAGGGMRVRILEAFAYGMPVVTTSIGLEGIEARCGADVLVADSAAEFANAVTVLLQNRALQERLASNGRRLAETRYDWRVALSALGQVYAS
jgi:glycosyltransferase involved in cell wall biosynthesis